MKRDLPIDDGTGIPLAQRLREELLDGRRPPGTRLPTERALAERFGLSRAGVRKALARLKAEGLISQRVGAGTFAAKPAGSALEVGPAELMQARIAFEPQIAELAVHNATTADFAKLDECLALGDRAETFEDFERSDARLHEVLAEATHNAMVLLVFRLLTNARRHSDWGALKRRSATPVRRAGYQREHRALVEALRERDAQKATALLREHLLHVQQNLFAG
jgi:DNA-binding FadR family transcriptional regulator